MAEQNPELQAKLQELEHELEVGLPLKQTVFQRCRMLHQAVTSEAARSPDIWRYTLFER
jgi:hypothetical protein